MAKQDTILAGLLGFPTNNKFNTATHPEWSEDNGACMALALAHGISFEIENDTQWVRAYYLRGERRLIEVSMHYEYGDEAKTARECILSVVINKLRHLYDDRATVPG